MESLYQFNESHLIPSPALLVFVELVERNLEQMIAIAGRPERLRPHCKTHKMPALIQRQLQRGITRHKCATLAEAEMLAQAGAQDIFLAYNLVGPNIGRAARFLRQYPEVRFSCTADHVRPLEQLNETLGKAGLTMEVVLDVDTGQHRTGVVPGGQAVELYQTICSLPHLQPGGLHVYDGQNHQSDLQERTRAVMAAWEAVHPLREQLEQSGCAVPRVIAGGTGSFPVFAQIEDPILELSPGTCLFHDAGYGEIFPDLDFVPAAVLLTRVVSRPTERRITLDLGYKACASDPPAGRRVRFPQLPDAREVLHNEEHLVIETDQAERFQPGDELLAIPRHICPTSALHQQAWIIYDGQIVDQWPITARDRVLSL